MHVIVINNHWLPVPHSYTPKGMSVCGCFECVAQRGRSVTFIAVAAPSRDGAHLLIYWSSLMLLIKFFFGRSCIFLIRCIPRDFIDLFCF